ncbi:RNA polymerase sigma factor (sigma-70 family) [Chryseobacterium ginsenosidimutans]|uniref:RNA polymerase sigma factor n=1 Tax=Chryseobacterium ginsenosidimutans TaxID=687846 RepID=UPI00278B4436|nr:RNA polymerase sigma factor [Chryseobacterium ginsenosidimutans]MDQ0593230.1 RNA polymerase sigma factor (sigma-70 family) [Chryseobacterium ginsenosidimutans]
MSKIKPDWNKIYLGLSPKLLGICRRYVQDIYTAEDIVQDSFITAMQKDHQLKDEKALFAWLKKIVVNNALQHIRKYSKDIFITTETSEIPDTSEMEHHLLEEKNVFIYDFTNEELLSSIDSLPPHHKSVFNLFFIENHSHAEISGLLGITVNTSKSHLLRAKKAVQNYLLNNVVDHNTPKKKMAQLLVIFGLGGLLWAQTFQSKLSDFTISPSKKLEIPKDIIIKSLTFSAYSGQVLTKKVAIISTFFVIIAGSIFFLSPKNLFPQNKTIINSAIVKEKQEISSYQVENLGKASNVSLDNKSANKNSTSEILTNSQEEISRIKTNEEGKKGKNIKKSFIKDSVDEETKKVIIVKKIIKRDTIFLER